MQDSALKHHHLFCPGAGPPDSALEHQHLVHDSALKHLVPDSALRWSNASTIHCRQPVFFFFFWQPQCVEVGGDECPKAVLILIGVIVGPMGCLQSVITTDMWTTAFFPYLPATGRADCPSQGPDSRVEGKEQLGSKICQKRISGDYDC